MPPRKSAKNQEPVYNDMIPVRRPQRSNASLVGIAVVLVVIVIVSLVAFYNSNRTNNLFNNDSDESTDTSADSSGEDYQVPLGVNMDQPQEPVQDPMAGWNSYKNASNTFAFKYPTNWQVKAEGTNLRLIYPNATDTQFIVSYQVTNKSLAEYLSDLDKVALTAYEGKPSVVVKNQQQIKVNGFDAIQRTQTMNAAGMEQRITYIYNNGKLLSVSIAAQKLSDEWNQAYDLILSGFQFITTTTGATSTASSTQASSTPKQVTYKNDSYKFQLQYQSDAKVKTVADGINFAPADSQFLNVKGVAGQAPSLIGYHPNGAQSVGQATIGGKEAAKFSVAKKIGGVDGFYVQYVLPLSNNKWLKIEYQGTKANIAIFEKIISTLKF